MTNSAPMSSIWFIPTRDRVDNAARLRDAFIETVRGPHNHFYFVVDGYDQDGQGYIEATQPYGLIVGPWTGLVNTLNFCASVALLNKYHSVGFMGDDHLPRSVGWDVALQDSLLEMGGSGIVYANDLYQESKLPTSVLMSLNIVASLGWMAPPILRHNYIDNFWLDLGNAIQRIKYRADIVIEHLHPLAGKADTDDSYESSSFHHNRLADSYNYELYLQRNFESDVITVLDRIASDRV